VVVFAGISIPLIDENVHCSRLSSSGSA